MQSHDKLETEFTVEDIQSSLQEQVSGELAVAALMTDVVEGATELMIQNHLDRVAIPYTVRCVTSEVLDYINAAFVGQDSGDVFSEGWSAGNPADGIALDSWSRGAVQVKKKPAPTTASGMTLDVPGGHEKQRSVRKAPSMLSVEKTLKKHERSQRDMARASNLSTTRRESVSGAKPLVGIAGPTPVPGSKKRGSVVAQKTTEAEEASREGGIEGSATLTADELEYALQVKAEQKRRTDTKQLADKINKQLDEMKGAKDVIVDGATGRVIPVRGVDAKNTTAGRKAEPKFVVPSDAVDTAKVLEKLTGSPGGRGGAGGKPGGRKPRRDISDFVQEENTYGPMVEGVTPSGGVIVKEGDSTKRGDLKVPKTKISRSEYKKMVEMVITTPDPDAEKVDVENPNVKIVPQLHPPEQNKEPKIPTPRRDEQQKQQQQQQQLQQQREEFKTQKTASLPSTATVVVGVSSPHRQHGVPIATSPGKGANHAPTKTTQMTAVIRAMADETQHAREPKVPQSANVVRYTMSDSSFEDDSS